MIDWVRLADEDRLVVVLAPPRRPAKRTPCPYCRGGCYTDVACGCSTWCEHHP